MFFNFCFDSHIRTQLNFSLSVFQPSRLNGITFFRIDHTPDSRLYWQLTLYSALKKFVTFSVSLKKYIFEKNKSEVFLEVVFGKVIKKVSHFIAYGLWLVKTVGFI